jgi:hypothetical protein
MLLARVNFREMATQLNVSLATIARDAAVVRAGWAKTHKAHADLWVAEELARLAAAEAAIWPQILAGKWLAIDRLLAIQDRRAKYLGLDAPAKVDITYRVRELAEQYGLDPDEAVRAAEEMLKAHA